MANTGRKRIPTSLKVVKGTYQPCRNNVLEPTGECIVLDVPVDLKGAARKFYKEVAQLIGPHGMQIATEWDRHQLYAMAKSWGTWYKLTKKMEGEYGFVYKLVQKDGEVTWRLRPENHIANDAFRAYNSLAALFGMNPSSRSKVNKIASNTASPMDNFITGKKMAQK